jgi:glutamyl-tRNA reductase
MELSIVGLNHRVAPVEVRERVAFDEARLSEALEGVRRATGATEAVILSTCNRVEIYAARPEATENEISLAARWLASHHGVPEPLVTPALYRHEGFDAVRHLYRVTAGLDAMILGETQIIAQVKRAYQAAHEGGHTGRAFNLLFQRALAVAKRIHATTGIGRGHVSVPGVAARLAEKVFQDLTRRRVAIVGAGETGELTLEAFRDRSGIPPVVINRTLENAERLAARHGGRAVPLSSLEGALAEADVVITCLATHEFQLTPDTVRAAMKIRRNEPMVILDLGVPRNVHPEVDRLENVYLFNVDDIESIAARNLLERERDLEQCLPIVDFEAQQTLLDLGEGEVGGLVGRLRAAMHAAADEEVKRTLERLGSLPPDQRDEIERMVRRVVNKMLHGPTLAIKEASREGAEAAALLETVIRLFKIR